MGPMLELKIVIKHFFFLIKNRRLPSFWLFNAKLPVAGILLRKESGVIIFG